MKIGFDAKRAFHNTRGLGSYSRNLIEGLNDYYPQHDYFLYTPVFEIKNQRWFAKYHKIKIKRPKNFLFETFSPLWRSWFLSQDIRQDDLHVFHGLGHELPFGIEKLHVKKIVTIHDLLFMDRPHHFTFIDRMIFYKKYHYSINVADVVIAICEHTKKDILKYFPIPEDKIQVIYQSCHQRFYDSFSKEKFSLIKNKYQLPSNYILYVGAIEENKNISLLIEAFSSSQSYKKDISLVLVGTGKSYRDKMINKIKEENRQNKIHFIKNVLDEELPGIYQNARFFVYPSFYEGFGIPIIEALFSGKAVVTSQSSGMPEAAGPGAKYINPQSIREFKESIDGLLENKSLREKLAQEGKEYVIRKFHRSHCLQALMNVYNTKISR